MTHTISVDVDLFGRIKSGQKNLMILKDDRNYVANDILIYQIPGEREELIMSIDYLEIEVPGLKSGYVAFSIKPKNNQ